MDFRAMLEGWGLDARVENLAVAGAVIAALVVFYLLKMYLWRRVISKHDNVFVHVFRRFSKPVQFLVILTAVTVILNTLVDDIDQEFWYQKIYAILTIGIFVWIAIKGVVFSSDLVLGRFNITVRDNLRARRIHTQVRVFRRLAIVLIVIVGIASALMVFEQIRALGVSLIASAGLAGIILGLAAQKTLGNFFIGVQIAITQPIRIGDAVIVEGEWGNIEEINLTYVVVKIWDWRRLVLPISYFVDKPFQNWTRNSADLIGSVFLYVDYTLPLAPLRAELDRILAEEDPNGLWDKNVKVIQVADATDKTMQLRVLVSASDAPSAWDLRCLVREHLIAFIQKNYPDHLPRIRTDLKEEEHVNAEGRVVSSQV